MSATSKRTTIDQQLEYWDRQIATGPGPFELPTDEPRPPASSFLRERTTLRLDAQRWAAVSALAASIGADPFSIVLGAFALVASRRTRQDQLWLGTVALARDGNGDEFQNLLALLVRVPSDGTVGAFLADVHAALATAAASRDVPYARVAAMAGAQPLFRAVVLPIGVRAESWEGDTAPDLEDLGPEAATCDLVLSVAATGDGAELQAEYDTELFRPDTIERLLAQIDVGLAATAAGRHAPLRSLSLLTETERQIVVHDWNRTNTDRDLNACTHRLIEEQVARTPNAVALAYAGDELTYADLNARANRLAHLLIAKGVGPDVPVGVCIERSHAMVIAVLAVHKAGGAYIPMDPSYPSRRIAYMVEDSGVRLLLADSAEAETAAGAVEVVRVDRLPEKDQPDGNPMRDVPSTSLAYIIYTSGSTGNPKGVMIEHRNVVNFFAGMDQRLGTRPGVWLAVTSLSFDISVLELLWTLTHGYEVVLYSSRLALGEAPAHGKTVDDAVRFGLFYFGSDEGLYAQFRGSEKYRLLIEGARFADDHGFCAVWTPERHFHTFGGMFPSPSVMAGALAMITKRIGIRSGSVVLPLHNPLRVAEEWSLVDNLSDGRVALSFTSGWQPQDFVMAPEAYADRHQRLFEGIETIRALWRGETREAPGGDGKPVTFSTRPRPVQPELPVWITAGGSPETFRRAGEIGANVITHLLQQSIEQLNERLAIYRKAWKEHGHEGEGGQVALMLHTFVTRDEEHVRKMVREPFMSYLKGAVGLFAAVAPKGVDVNTLSPADMEALAEHAFERYFESSGLFGTPESCVAKIARLKHLGVTEIACLIDFGIPAESVLASLPYLDDLRRRCAAAGAMGDQSIGALIQRHGVTHLQCTPSMAGMLIADPETAPALGKLEQMLVGGEALSETLAAALKRALTRGTLINMYGPTETTVWSMCHEVTSDAGPVPIGRPMANTQVYILDAAMNPVPVGVTGELHIGGDGVARGYFKRPELNRERFVDDPFRRGQRLYRTGDLARHRRDGSIDFIGRSDNQVKLRGYRIELEEIERALIDHPGVDKAAAALHGAVDGDLRLVAYIVSEKGRIKSDAASLRQYLRSQLPDYMVPGEFVYLDRLPLTPNGKLDRKALLKAEGSYVAGAVFAPPETPTEQTLASLWAEVLRIDRIGLNDNFFELGGHSLLAMHIISRVRGAMSIQLPLRELFAAPTLSGLAARIDVIRAQPSPGHGLETIAWPGGASQHGEQASNREEIDL
jgi:natural product biosynthesis luciferase-like monooxygenase protein